MTLTERVERLERVLCKTMTLDVGARIVYRRGSSIRYGTVVARPYGTATAGREGPFSWVVFDGESGVFGAYSKFLEGI